MVATHSDYIQLRKELEGKGLLGYTPIYYAFSFFINFLLIVLLFAIVFYFNKMYITVICSILLAFIGMRFGYFGHDAGHMSISKNRFINDLVGQFGHSFLLGISFTYWRETHNKHHSEPNHQDIDPDIKDGDPFSLTEKKAKQRTGFVKFMTKHQSFLLVPAFFGLNFSKRYLAFEYMLKNKGRVMIDAIMIFFHIIFFFLVVPYFIGLLQAFVLYMIFSLLIGFYFGLVFITNHIGMPVLSGDEKLSFVEKQIVTSRDIKGDTLLNFLSGGLNYQIEHHLFPHLSRKHLPKIKPIVKEFCIKKDLTYTDVTLLQAWKEVFTYIKNVSRHANSLNVFKAVNDMV